MRWPRVEYNGPPESPQIKRWVLLRCRWFQIVLHIWYRSDDRVVHDHEWWNVSVRLWGSALEFVDCFPTTAPGAIHYPEPMKFVTYRRATDRHHIQLVSPRLVTLFITGPKQREWGYYVREQFVPWRNYQPRRSNRR